MNNMLNLAADFIEKMNNPANGPLINEEYGLRMGEIIGSETFQQIFIREVDRLEDPNALSSYGWIWLIRWCRINNIKLKETLSTELMQRWSNVFIQSFIIEMMTNESANRDEQWDIRSSGSDWLYQQIYLATSESRKENSQITDDAQLINTSAAKNLLIALLQLGSEIAINAARYLLEYQWQGRQELLVFFSRRYERLDEDTKAIWIDQIRPPFTAL